MEVKFVRRSVEELSAVFRTGFNTCCGGFELKDGFMGPDVTMGGCLDASHYVPIGSVRRQTTDFGSYSETHACAKSSTELASARMGL